MGAPAVPRPGVPPPPRDDHAESADITATPRRGAQPRERPQACTRSRAPISGPRPEAATPDRPGAARAREEEGRSRPEPGRRQDHGLLGLDAVRLHPPHLVRLLDRLRGRGLPVRAPDDDRLAGGDLPLDLRLDQPEPGGRQAPGDRRRAVENGAGGGQAERGTAQAQPPHPQADRGGPGSVETRAPGRLTPSRSARSEPPRPVERAAPRSDSWAPALLSPREPGRRNRRTADAFILLFAAIVIGLTAVVASETPEVAADVSEA